MKFSNLVVVIDSSLHQVSVQQARKLPSESHTCYEPEGKKEILKQKREHNRPYT